MTKMIAGQALVKVLEDWGVDHVYGIPGGSINHTVEGLYLEKDKMKYIQVRHEEVGAIAASADAKFTGKIGVAFHQRLRHRACCHSERKPPEISEQLSARLGGTAGNLHRKLLPFRRSRPHGRASEKSFGFGNCKETQKNSRSNNCPLASAVRLHRDSGKRKTFPHCRKL